MQFALYYYESCPFCQRVLKPLRLHQWPVALHDIMLCPADREDLIHGSGCSTVPCLKITDNQEKEIWMHESIDILALLQRHFNLSEPK
ncbi:MAG: glutaredoxin domain-containing protein [Gammaproteobacteria bacterium]